MPPTVKHTYILAHKYTIWFSVEPQLPSSVLCFSIDLPFCGCMCVCLCKPSIGRCSGGEGQRRKWVRLVNISISVGWLVVWEIDFNFPPSVAFFLGVSSLLHDRHTPRMPICKITAISPSTLLWHTLVVIVCVCVCVSHKIGSDDVLFGNFHFHNFICFFAVGGTATHGHVWNVRLWEQKF